MCTENKTLTILFQGDSITDAGRNFATDDLGPGYAGKVGAYLDVFAKDKNIKVINKGIGGNRVKDLKARWDYECIDLKPDILSILIGINDTWRKYDSGDPTTCAAFEATYREILTEVKEKLPECQIVICEPFIIPVDPSKEEWREDLDPKIGAVRRLAREFEAIFIPLDGLYAELCAQNDPALFSDDGVHPNDAGHAFLAEQWLYRVMDIL